MKDIEELYNYLSGMFLMLISENADVSSSGIRETTTSVILKDIILRMGSHEDKDSWLMQEENNYGIPFFNKRRMVSLAGEIMQLDAFHLANNLLKENLLILDNEELRHLFIDVLAKYSGIYLRGFQSEQEKEFYKKIEAMYKEYGTDKNDFKRNVLKVKIEKSMEKKQYKKAARIIKAYPEIVLQEISFLVPTGGFGESEPHTIEVFLSKVSCGKIKIDTDSMPWIVEIQKALLTQSIPVNNKPVNVGIKRI